MAVYRSCGPPSPCVSRRVPWHVAQSGAIHVYIDRLVRPAVLNTHAKGTLHGVSCPVCGLAGIHRVLIHHDPHSGPFRCRSRTGFRLREDVWFVDPEGLSTNRDS